MPAQPLLADEKGVIIKSSPFDILRLIEGKSANSAPSPAFLKVYRLQGWSLGHKPRFFKSLKGSIHRRNYTWIPPFLQIFGRENSP